MANYKELPRRLRRIFAVLFFTGIVGFVSLPVFVLLSWEFTGDMRFRKTVKDPGADFTRLTGFAWPATAKIVTVDDSHGGFNGDGEFHLIIESDQETIQSILDSSPPWNQAEWKDGPVPTEIGFHCRFGSVQGVAAVQIIESQVSNVTIS